MESGPDNNSPSVVRFLSCRWRKAAEDGVPDHCTHRDVLPMAGKEGFNADSWCTDCALYKAKRMPRKPTSKYDDFSRPIMPSGGYY